jgi:hypothetical protein
MVEKRNAYRILVGTPEGKRPLGRPRHRWMDNVKIDLKQIGWDGMDWIYLAQDRRDQWRTLVNKAINLRVPWNIGNFFSNWATGNFSRRSKVHGVN